MTEGSPRGGALRSLSRFSWRRPGLKTFGQISAPVAAFLFVYVAALVALLIQGFWTTDSFTGKVIHSWNLDNFRAIANDAVPDDHPPHARDGVGRDRHVHAARVPVRVLPRPDRRAGGCASRCSSRRCCPLWVSYLVRVYSWRLILNPDGALNWFLNGLGLPDQNIAYTNWAMWLVFTYIWFPFMVLPVYAALERVPYSLHRGVRRPRRPAASRRCAA